MTILEKLLLTLIIMGAICFGSYRTGFSAGESFTQAKWDRQSLVDKAYDDARREEYIDNLRRQAAQHDRITTENFNAYETKIAQVSADLAAARAESKRLGGLRITVPTPTCSSDRVDAIAKADSALSHYEAAATTIALPEQIEADLWSIVGEADQVTEQLRSCQAWIKAEGFFGEN